MFSSGDILVISLTVLLSIFLFKPIFHKMQMHNYSFLAMLNKSKVFEEQYCIHEIIGALFCLLMAVGFGIDNKILYSFVITVMFFISEFLALNRSFSVQIKKPLVYTKRIIRLYVFNIAVVSVLLTFTVLKINEILGFYYNKFAIFSMPILLPIVSYLVYIIIWPFEKLNNYRYIVSAKNKLQNYNYLIKIAITGSFGKTTVKNILRKMLEQKYRVVATEGSFNTPLGISKTVNNLDEYADVFIAEMGARHKNDIKKLVNMVKPTYAIVTGVTAQHLQTFKTIDNIYNEKFTLVNSLPMGGYAIVNGLGIDRDITVNTQASVDIVGIKGCIAYATDISVSQEGNDFNLILDGHSYKTHTKLLGEHNIQNIVVASAMAYRLKITPAKIIETIATLTPIPHRLQLMKNGGLTVIDDTYNANPIGVREALKVLSQFSGRKIVVTPGMVELGKQENTENFAYGKEIAHVADLVILIGKVRTLPIKEGLIQAGFDEKKILTYKSLADAEREFGVIMKTGDTILFSNDLPDNYTE